MRYQPRRQRDRIADNLCSAMQDLNKKGQEGNEEYQRVQRWYGEARFGSSTIATQPEKSELRTDVRIAPKCLVRWRE